MNQELKPQSRRTFIKNMALMGGAGTLLASAAGNMPQRRRGKTSGSPEVRRSRGYRLTPHIRRYYKNAAY
jgi:hypothetical protein